MISLPAIWLLGASASVTLAMIHLSTWLIDRRNRAQFLFSILALAVSLIAVCELQMMRSDSVEHFRLWFWRIHMPLFVALVSMVWFIRASLGTGRLWFAWGLTGLRGLILILNFICTPNFNYRSLDAIERVPVIGGGTVAVAQGQASQRTYLGRAGNVLLLVFVLDASIKRFGRGTPSQRRLALIVGGSVAVFVFLSTAQTALIVGGSVKWPYMISLAFVFPVVAMGYELGADVARAAGLARELDRSRAELLDVKQRMDLAAKAAGLAMWRWEIGRDEIWMSEAGRSLFGFTRNEPISIGRFAQILHPQDRQRFLNAARQFTRETGEYASEYRIVHPDGRVRWIVGRGRVEFNGNRTPLRVHGISLDITERRQAEEQFRQVFDVSPSAMVIVNERGRIARVNARTESVFGYSREELIGQPVEVLVPLNLRELHAAHCARFREMPIPGPMSKGDDLLCRRKDGSEIPVEIGLNPVESSDGGFVLASILDVSERRNIERERQRQRDELAHLSRVAMLGELSGSLAHELNQPLTAILSNAQAAQEFLSGRSPDLQEVRGILEDIVQEDRRAGEVIRRLRALFRKGEVNYESIDLNDLIRDVLRLLNSDLVNHDVDVATRFAESIPAVNADRVQLQQVLINLIVNACDAMSASSTRRITVGTSMLDGQEVEIRVSDTGCGIPPEQLRQIFEPFHTTKAHGMGLGLAVCRTIILAHAGRLWASNNPSGGASFHVALPPFHAGVT
jgi:PAS domain S-box-containing protein